MYWEHFKRIMKYKILVFKECWLMSKELYGKRKLSLIIHGFTHDLSKFSLKEFIPTARYYNGMGNESDFEWASECHYFKNKHHWEYWNYDSYGVELETPNPIPIKYIIQMLCEWNVISSKLGITSKEYYLNNLKSIKLEYFTKFSLEYLLSVSEDDYEKNTEGYVYFIRNKETKAIKIGYSVNPKKRIKQLSTGSSSVLDLIYVIEGSKDVEYFLHRYFASERVNLEWFDEELVLQWIQNDKITSNYLQKEQGLEDKMG